MPIATIKINEPQGITKTPLEIALEKIKELEFQVSALQEKINVYGSVVTELHSRVVELEKGKVKKPIYEEEALEKSIKQATNEISKALKALHDELIK